MPKTKPKKQSKKPISTRKQPRKTARKKKNSKKLRFKKLVVKLLLLVFILLTLGSLLTYWYINNQVKDLIISPETAGTSAVYTDSLRFPLHSKFRSDTAIKVLKSYAYKQMKSQPEKPGYFHINNKQLTVYRRSYYNQLGEHKQEKLYKLEINSGYLNNKTPIELEPQIYSLLGKGNNKYSDFMPLSQIPKSVGMTVINTEDARFYEHFGIDPIGILRALITNILKGGLVQGGSTLNQQLAKNLLFSAEKTLSRKVLEAFAAISFEQHLSKDKILELYLNEVYLGQSGATAIHGFPAASNFFFNKSVEQLTLSEVALLSGIIKAPSYYSPIRNYQRAIERRDLVLKMLLENNKINKKEYLNALSQKIIINQQSVSANEGAFFTNALTTNLQESFSKNFFRKNLVKVQTGLNPVYQKCAERAVQDELSKIEQNYPKLKYQPLEVGLVSIEPASGLIKSWIGGRNYQKNQFDHVVLAERQIGSVIKPFVYLTALDKNLNQYKPATAITILTDQPIEVKTESRQSWTPKNYDGNFRGAVTLRYALERSLNIPAVYVSQKVGLQNVARTIKNFRINQNPSIVPSMALGSLETKLFNITAAYSALANEGRYVKPRFYNSLLSNENELIKYNQLNEDLIADPNAVFVLTNILQGVVDRGTASKVKEKFKLPAAGKTGTTNDSRDAWFIGYTPELTTGIWVGLDNNKKLGLGGSSAAAPIWANYMSCISPLLRGDDFLKPPQVDYIKIDSETGLLYEPNCSGEPITEVFIRGTEPPITCNYRDYNPEKLQEDLPKESKQNKSVFDLLFG